MLLLPIIQHPRHPGPVMHELLDRRRRVVLPVLQVEAVAPRPLASRHALERADLVEARQHPLLMLVLVMLLLVEVCPAASCYRRRRRYLPCGRPGLLVPELRRVLAVARPAL